MQLYIPLMRGRQMDQCFVQSSSTLQLEVQGGTRMKFRILIIGLVTAVLLPTAAFADAATASDKANGARACNALRTSLGEATFNSTYGTNADKSNAFGQCVSQWTRAEHQNRLEALTACKAEQADAGFAAAHGDKTFAQFYGTGKNGANALQRCVQSKRHAASVADRKATVNAARSCKAERKELGDAAFIANYGGKANAFGKCVAKLAQAQQG
jgi:hypothetical protein